MAPDRVVEVTGEPVTVPGDAARLDQVLGNLLAKRAAPSGGRIAIAVSENGAAAVLATDSGSGVPIAERERIFDRLVRLDEARTADSGGGAGLGLSSPAGSPGPTAATCAASSRRTVPARRSSSRWPTT